MKSIGLSRVALAVACATAVWTTGMAAADTPLPAVASAVIRADVPGAVINRNIYGQFTEHLGHCIYGGIWVGENSPIPNTRGIRNDVVAALKKVEVPLIRWPGGCFADEYHWKNGIGPKSQRPSMINNNWGGVVEDNSFGTHEFLDFCEQVGAEPYISVNVGTGSRQEMMEWIEYMTSDAVSPMANLRRQNGRDKPWKVKYIALGNESWGCGGNMRPEYYSDQYRQFSAFFKEYGDNKIYRIACGANEDDYNWTEVVVKNSTNMYEKTPGMEAISLHKYTIPTGVWKKKGSATEFGEAEWFSVLKGAFVMDEYVTKHCEVLDRVDPAKKVELAVDEWGVWTDVEPGTNPGFLFQQNSLRDALLAALHFNVFHSHANRVTMSNIAQMINVLQSLILTDKEKMILTPTYHVFDLYKVFHDATYLPVDISSPDYIFDGKKIPAVSATAAKDKAGHIHVGLVNTTPGQDETVTCDLRGANLGTVSGRILTAATMTAHNTFEQPNAVQPQAFSGATVVNGKLQVKLPAKSIVVLDLN